MEGQYQWHPFIVCRPGLISSLLNTVYVVHSKLYFHEKSLQQLRVGGAAAFPSQTADRNHAQQWEVISFPHYVRHPQALTDQSP